VRAFKVRELSLSVAVLRIVGNCYLVKRQDKLTLLSLEDVVVTTVLRKIPAPAFS
jgi:hypothetical protein